MEGHNFGSKPETNKKENCLTQWLRSREEGGTAQRCTSPWGCTSSRAAQHPAPCAHFPLHPQHLLPCTHQTLLPCTKETPLPCTHSTSAATKVQLAGVTRIGWQETPAKYCTLGGLNYESVRRMRKQKDFLVPDNGFPLSNPFYSLHSAAQRSSSLLGVAL